MGGLSGLCGVRIGVITNARAAGQRSMIGYGAVVTDTQIPQLVDYMFRTYGKK